jgi:hypothetical protein
MPNPRDVKEVIRRVYPHLYGGCYQNCYKECYKECYKKCYKKCIYCPIERRPCGYDEFCPCPWRGVKLQIVHVLRWFNAPPPVYVRKGSFFDDTRNIS